MIKDIQDNMLIICENDYKKNILKNLSKNKKFLNVKIMSKKEFLGEYLFKYDEKTISYLVNTYNYKVSIAKMYLDNLYYVDDFVYKSNKLNFLVKLKRELIDKKLLIFNDNFKKIIEQYNILVVGYPYLEKYELDIFNKLKSHILKDDNKYDINKVYEFETMTKEVNFVCKSIAKLIDAGVDINKIKLVGIDTDYYNDLDRIFKFYNIPIKITNGESLYGFSITKKFLDNLNYGLKKSIEVIKNEDSTTLKKIINICNKYVMISDIEKIKPLIIHDLKNTYIDNFKLKNYVEIVDLFYPFNDEYVFVMNFNEGVIPYTFRDEEYINDNIKDEINLNSTNDKNKIYKISTIDKLKSIKNLTITYKLKSSNKEFYPSILVSELNLDKIKLEDNILESYSLLNDKIEYAKLQDNYLKYGSISDNLYIYQNSLGNISYNTYDNKFRGVDNRLLKDFLKGKLTLSYTSLNNFNKCAFRFYLANILKLEKYEENFEAFIGSLFHDCLEKCVINNLNVEEEINNYIKENNKKLNIKEQFFVNMIIEDIKFVIEVLNKQKEQINLDKAMYEENIVIDKSNNDYEIKFMGIIDKILYKELDDRELISIIDYKTGNIDIDLKYLPYGLSLQLPIYLYLVKNSNYFKNPQFVGFYLQHILDKDIKRDIKKNYNEERYNNLKLMGYSNKEVHSLVEFDKNYENSSLIKGMKVKNDGDFSSYAKVLSDDEINKIIDMTEKNIDWAIDKILNGEFNINPKKIGYDKDIGCMYCKFKDICFKKEDDYQILEEIKDLSFLSDGY